MPSANHITSRAASWRSRILLAVILLAPLIAIAWANTRQPQTSILAQTSTQTLTQIPSPTSALATPTLTTERWAAPLIALAPPPLSISEHVDPIEQPRPATTPPPLAASPQIITPSQLPDHRPTFNHRPLRPVRTVRMKVTAYSPDERSCENFADYITASGYSVYTNAMKLVAADTRLFPFGTVVTIPGYNNSLPVTVLDRGGAIKGLRIDVLYPTHDIARRWGVQNLDVTIWAYDD